MSISGVLGATFCCLLVVNLVHVQEPLQQHLSAQDQDMLFIGSKFGSKFGTRAGATTTASLRAGRLPAVLWAPGSRDSIPPSPVSRLECSVVCVCVCVCVSVCVCVCKGSGLFVGFGVLC